MADMQFPVILCLNHEKAWPQAQLKHGLLQPLPG